MKNRFLLPILAVALIFSVFTPSLKAQNLDFPFYEMPKEPTQQEIDAAKKTLVDYLNPPESATKKEILSRTNFFHGPDEVNKAYQILLRSKKNDVTFLTNPVLALSFRALSLPDLTQEEKSEIFRTITAYYLTRVVSQQWTQEKAQQEIDSLSKNITPSDRKHVAWYIELYSCRFQEEYTIKPEKMQELWQEAYKNGILNRLTVQQGMANLGIPARLPKLPKTPTRSECMKLRAFLENLQPSGEYTEEERRISMLNMELYAYACDWQVILKEISENQEDENFLKTPKLQETCKTLLDETETCLNQFVETKTPYIWGLEQLIFSGRIVYSVLPERSAGYRETVAQFLTLYPIPDYERMDAETMRKHILDDWFPK